MEVYLNGKTHKVEEGLNVGQLLALLGIRPKTAVVELNRRIVKADQYPVTMISAHDEIEVVQFVGGGAVGTEF